MTLVPAVSIASVWARLLAGKSLTVDASCVPVWVARSRSAESVAFAVAAVAMPASFVKSALAMEPAAEPLAGVMPMAGDPPPVDVIGAVPVTAATPAPPAVALI